MNETNRVSKLILTGIRYPGDDGSEPDNVRDAKAKAYAARVAYEAEYIVRLALEMMK